MEFGPSGAIQLTSRSQTRCKPVCDQVQAISTCRDSSNPSATARKPAPRVARELACYLLASWIAPDMPNSITLSSSLAGRRPVREAASELDGVMEFGLYQNTVNCVRFCFWRCDFFYVLLNISETGERFCAKFTGKTCLVPRLDESSNSSQRGTKHVFRANLVQISSATSRSISAACMWFMFGKTCLL